MVRNRPDGGAVTPDGDPISSPPTESTPLSRLYFL